MTLAYWRAFNAIGLVLCVHCGCNMRGMLADNGKSQALKKFGESRDEWGVPERPNEKLVVEQLLTTDCIRRIRSTLRPAEEGNSIVAGNLDAMEATRQCWSVEVDTGFIGGVAAYYDLSGELLLAWRIPEG